MRRLTLTKDVLTELRPEDLAAVVAGEAVTTPVGGCVTDATAVVVAVTSRLVECDSLLRPCVTSTCER